jgi:hypothetical protein
MKCTVLSICYFEEYEESKRRMFFSELLEWAEIRRSALSIIDVIIRLYCHCHLKSEVRFTMCYKLLRSCNP